MYCLNEEGGRIWFHSNLYYREGRGNVTSATEWGITDLTQEWVENSFMRMDGKDEILVPDMMGTLTILNKRGKEIGQVNVKGGIEGTPLVGDLDGDGKIEVFLTSLDGYARMFRFT